VSATATLKAAVNVHTVRVLFYEPQASLGAGPDSLINNIH
jgi:hypothetical protein